MQGSRVLDEVLCESLYVRMLSQHSLICSANLTGQITPSHFMNLTFPISLNVSVRPIPSCTNIRPFVIWLVWNLWGGIDVLSSV